MPMPGIRISEWLPNPEGNDAAGEWVEVFNDGNVAVNLSGWRLENAAGKSVALKGALAPGERKVFHRSATKLTLRNEGEALSLISPAGEVVDTSSFFGLAPEGKSVNKEGERTWLAAPTPGAANAEPLTASIAESVYPVGTPLSEAGSGWPGALLGTTLLLTVAGTIIMRTYDQADTLPGRDQSAGG